MQTLSLCMITKNEEKNLSRCLDSVKDIVDEIIIVDTGSTDNTVDIGKKYGAKIFFYEWNNDFASARNESLKYATSDWIIFLDADEELPKEDGEKLIKTINTTPLEGLFLRLENIINDTNLGDAVVLRVFRNNPLYRFKGKMHEQIIFSIDQNSGVNKVLPTTIKIIHYGYDPKFSDIETKKKRNLDILESYPEEDRDGYFYYSLGNEYSRIGDLDKAIELYHHGIDYTQKYDVNAMPSYLPYLVINLAKNLSALKKYMEAIEFLKKAEGKYPSFRDLYFLECLYFSECCKLTEAKEALLKYLNCDYSHYIYPDNNYEESFNMGVLLRKLRKSSVKKSNDLLSVVFLGLSYDDTLTTSIKSINEVANEVIVTIPTTSILDKNLIENLGAKVVTVNTPDAKKLFMDGIKSCTSKFILIMKPREVMPGETHTSLIQFLLTTKEHYANIVVENINDKAKVGEFRLFRNNEEVKNTTDFDTFIRNIEAKKINTYDILINRG